MNYAPLTVDTIRLLLPEILLVLLALWAFVAGGLLGIGRTRLRLVTLCGLVAVAWTLYLQDTGLDWLIDRPVLGHSGPVMIDSFGHLARWAVFGTGVLLVLTAARDGPNRLAGEYIGFLLLVVTGMMLVCTAGDLILLFLGLELISIPTYVLLFLSRKGPSVEEATAKYFFLSLLASSLFLYGLSFLYGVTGTVLLERMPAALSAGSRTATGLGMLAPLALLLILAGLGFKMAAVPFHFYAPDVYQGTSNAVAGLLAVAPKAAGLVVLVRILAATASQPGVAAWRVALIIAVASMTWGNVVALWQQNIRRLMAYSSIAHAGYLFIGISVALAAPAGMRPTAGVAAALFYLLVYIPATLGTFAALAYLGEEGNQIDHVDQLAGLAKTRPLVAMVLAVFMFSLTGIPPLAGFWGKLVLLTGALTVAVDSPGPGLPVWFVGLAVLGALNAAVSAGYYLRVVGVIYFRPSADRPPAAGGREAWWAAVVSALLVLAIGLVPGPWLANANRAASAVRPGILREESSRMPVVNPFSARQSHGDAPRTRMNVRPCRQGIKDQRDTMAETTRLAGLRVPPGMSTTERPNAEPRTANFEPSRVVSYRIAEGS